MNRLVSAPREVFLHRFENPSFLAVDLGPASHVGVGSASFSPDGSRIVTRGDVVRILVATPTRVERLVSFASASRKASSSAASLYEAGNPYGDNDDTGSE
jgi:hypothetical protein